MTEKIELDLEKNSPYRVALDLAYEIARSEKKIASTSALGSTEGGERKYWLELYAQCRRVVLSGASAEQALKLRGPKQAEDDKDPVLGLRG